MGRRACVASPVSDQGNTGKPLSGSILAFQKPCCKRGVRVFCESALGFSRLSLEKAPEETTILNFCHLLKRHGLGKKLFETTKEYRTGEGLTLKEGTILDARTIAMPTSMKNRRGESDPEIQQTRVRIIM